MFQGVQRRMRAGVPLVLRAQRNGQRQRHPGQRGMHAGLENEIPEHGADQQIRRQAQHSRAVEAEQAGQQGARHAQGERIERRRIEQRNDDDGAQVVQDRQRGQEDLQRRRHAAAQQRQDTQREGDVGRGGNGPAAQRGGAAGVDQHVNERRHRHAAQRRDAWQHDAAGAAQLAVQHFALDLQPDQQEEHGHQAVVDPMQHGFLEHDGSRLEAQLGFERAEVIRGGGAIGDGQRDQRGQHENVAAERFGLEERLEERGRFGAGRSRGGHCWSVLDLQIEKVADTILNFN
ncbi:hypothetical protein FQZ97_632220 [compost metagenome]